MTRKGVDRKGENGIDWQTKQQLEDNMVRCFKSVFGLIIFLFFASTAWGTPWHVEIRDFFFSPATVTIVAGDTVQWEVIEQCCLQHTVTRTTSPNTWNSGAIPVGETYERAFPSSGTFTYYCANHLGLGMTGSIIVRPKPSYTGLPVLNGLGLLFLGLSLTAAAIWFLERRRQTA